MDRPETRDLLDLQELLDPQDPQDLLDHLAQQEVLELVQHHLLQPQLVVVHPLALALNSVRTHVPNLLVTILPSVRSNPSHPFNSLIL